MSPVRHLGGPGRPVVQFVTKGPSIQVAVTPGVLIRVGVVLVIASLIWGVATGDEPARSIGWIRFTRANLALLFTGVALIGLGIGLA